MAEQDDPYWDFFINRAPFDPRNLVTDVIRQAPEGNVYPHQSEVHSPDITSQHIKELAQFFGADIVGIVRLPEQPGNAEAYPFAIVCVLRADYDPREAKGVGGQTPVFKGAYVTFNLGAYIREFGYRATRIGDTYGERLAAAAGLGTLNARGRLVTRQFGEHVYVADVICTDLPLAPDGEETGPWPPTS